MEFTADWELEALPEVLRKCLLNYERGSIEFTIHEGKLYAVKVSPDTHEEIRTIGYESAKSLYKKSK
jgi:hypothetical protein